MVDKDITEEVEISGYDEEMISITRCICGQKFPSWEFIVDIYRNSKGNQCSNCGRMFYCSFVIKVFEVGENGA